jgi:hypothetical protein
MAPEVIKETGHGPKADTWSIGATVFEMVKLKTRKRYKTDLQFFFYI